ncbi:hypothetical protein MUU49_21055 [Scandinavium goeteborgense]|uniref:hypothetical protein n=1 Tax=Scandinavium goeteborgense TaxID=1851514 RepID=UPI002165625B|nr:hypothetical protein [Scandinavium goeteborgense]MCS2155042.1 hypothetical protein [Scandinavium goeteborgense]
MTNIFTLKNPISSITEMLLSRIKQICTAQEIPFFIAGATAREILLHHVHGRSIGRRTRDIDIAVFVDGWPPDREIIMAVDGFSDAFSHTVIVQLGNAEKLPFCSLPGLALLKLFAWRDRGQVNAKDATDLYKINREYGAIEDERIYDQPVEGERLGWDSIRMGASLLGSDIAAIGEPSSLAELKRFDTERLTDVILRQSGLDDVGEIELIMDDFWNGITSGN